MALRGPARIACLLLCLLAASACTQQIYYREDGARVTVKKFAGVPYLEKEEKTTSKPPGSD